MEKEISHGGITYNLQRIGDGPLRNETLVVRMRQENIELPEFDPEMSIEDYFRAVEAVLVANPKWRIRRYVTVGHFSFHRVAMYEDLDPGRWPEDKKPFQQCIVRELLGGRERTPGSGHHEVYNPDDPQLEEKAPLLIRDADSSQFSAVMVV